MGLWSLKGADYASDGYKVQRIIAKSETNQDQLSDQLFSKHKHQVEEGLAHYKKGESFGLSYVSQKGLQCSTVPQCMDMEICAPLCGNQAKHCHYSVWRWVGMERYTHFIEALGTNYMVHRTQQLMFWFISQNFTLC